MKLIDITRELTASPVYPGDTAPELVRVKRMENGDPYNLTQVSLSLHNGTHLDAPRHFIPDGATVDQLDLAVLCGECLVVEFAGIMLGDAAESMLASFEPEMPQRLLLKGSVLLSPSAAFVLSDAGIRLLGVENGSVCAPVHTLEVHRQLLGSGMILLENLDLSSAGPGRYTLLALPLLIGGAEGAPIRAVLVAHERLDIESSFIKRR